MSFSYFTVDTSAVIFERFDDEVIAINLNRGTYYSLNATAAEIFELAAMQPSQEDIIVALTNRYDAAAGEVEAEVARFLTELESEGLIERSQSRGAPPPLAVSAPKTVFVAPLLTAHRDMQDLFLLDPIHEVGDAGWPQKQESLQADTEQ